MQHYLVSLVDFKMQKKMYQPTEIIANLQVYMAEGSEWKPVDKKIILKAFNHRRVSLDVLEETAGSSLEDAKVVDTVGNDFYVQEVIPTYKATSLFVELKIYSLDKLMTLSQYCSSWTAKKLCAHILDKELPNYKLPYDDEKHVECDTSNLKHLVKDGQEHIFPYLVQYNESFYDMLVRTCNRWGEFVCHSAVLISSNRSSPASRPMLRRTVVSGTDISAHCSAVKRPKMVEAGCIASDLRSKRFVARRITCNLSMNAHAASFDSRSMVKTAPGNGPNCASESSWKGLSSKPV